MYLMMLYRWLIWKTEIRELEGIFGQGGMYHGVPYLGADREQNVSTLG